MPEITSIRARPHVPTTPAEIARGRPRGLPDDLLAESSERLAVLAMVSAIIWFVYAVVGTFVFRTGVASITVSQVLSPVFAAVSLGVFVFAKRYRGDPGLIMDLGLIYGVLLCFAVSIVENWEPIRDPELARRISWAPLIIVTFSLIVPSTPGKAVLAALTAATTGPLALLLLVAVLGNPRPSAWTGFFLFLPNYLAVGVAMVNARVIYKLGEDVSQARRMGSYQLVELIGKGGMGEVWEAKHSMLRRPAAIKLVRAEMLGGTVDSVAAMRTLRRFEQEAQATAQLTSPHTVRVFDCGISDDGIFYFVMEKLHGIDLETLVRKFGPLPPARAVHLLVQACDSLAEAHLRGLVHRDIKPANLLACRVGIACDYVKVLDFGLVKTGDSEAISLTADGVTNGTPAFMAPEIAMGESTADGRADLYSLGCVAYWLLTGRPVFPGDVPMKVMMDHVREIPDPPSKHAPGLIPAELEKLVLDCLAKEPGDRPQNASALAGRLRACHLDGGWSGDDARRWWREFLPSLGLVPETRIGPESVEDQAHAA